MVYKTYFLVILVVTMRPCRNDDGIYTLNVYVDNQKIYNHIN